MHKLVISNKKDVLTDKPLRLRYVFLFPKLHRIVKTGFPVYLYFILNFIANSLKKTVCSYFLPKLVVWLFLWKKTILWKLFKFEKMLKLRKYRSKNKKCFLFKLKITFVKNLLKRYLTMFELKFWEIDVFFF